MLVHGTQLFRGCATAFGRLRESLRLAPRGSTGKLWSDFGQPLRQRLEQMLGGDTVVVDMPWSGRNQHDARQLATDGLLQTLSAQKKAHPSARLYVIAHSHGGNVSRDVLLRDGGRELLDGLVCLSTPFFYARERPQADRLRRRLIVFCLALIAAPFVAWKYASTRFHMDAATFSGVGALVLIGLSALTVRMTRRVARADLYAHTLQRSRFDGTAILLVHSAGDEAFRWLKMSEWVPVLAQYLTRGVDRVALWWKPKKWLRRSLVAGLLVLAGLFTWFVSPLAGFGPDGEMSLAAPPRSLPRDLLETALMFSGTVTLPVGVVLVVFIVTPAVLLTLIEIFSLLAKSAAFGFPTWRYEVSTEPGIVGGATFMQLPAMQEVSGLWHSQSYLHPDTPEIIAKWIESVEASKTNETACRSKT